MNQAGQGPSTSGTDPLASVKRVQRSCTRSPLP
jgi:hypothetical protein